MAFVGGLTGPYMRPIPVGASLAMLFSTVVAFAITPWTAQHVLKTGGAAHHEDESRLTRVYRRVMDLLIRRGVARAAFLLANILSISFSIKMYLRQYRSKTVRWFR